MKRKLWFYLFWVQFALTLVVLVVAFAVGNQTLVVKEGDVGAYLAEREDYKSTHGGYTNEAGYIPDAQTAAEVGGAILDSVCKKDWTLCEGVEVEYDPVNRLWKVQKGYFPRYYGGIVVLDQDSGEVLDLILQK